MKNKKIWIGVIVGLVCVALAVCLAVVFAKPHGSKTIDKKISEEKAEQDNELPMVPIDGEVNSENEKNDSRDNDTRNSDSRDNDTRNPDSPQNVTTEGNASNVTGSGSTQAEIGIEEPASSETEGNSGNSTRTPGQSNTSRSSATEESDAIELPFVPAE